MVDTEEILVNPLDELELSKQPETTPKVEEPKENSDNSKETEEKPEEVKPEKEEPKKEEKPTPKEVRHSQQMEGAKKEVERLRNLVIEAEVFKVSQDAKALLELAEKDAKLADEVAKKFGYDSLRDAKEQITGVKIEVEKPSEEEFETYYQQRKSKEEHEEALNEAKTLLEQLPEALQEEAINEFNELIEGKQLTKAKAAKLVSMVTLSLSKGKQPKTDVVDGLKKLSTTGISNSKKVTKDEPQMVIFDGQEILLDSNKSN